MKDPANYLGTTSKKPYLNNTTVTLGIPSNYAGFCRIDEDTEVRIIPEYDEDGTPCLQIVNDELYTGEPVEKPYTADRVKDWLLQTKILLNRLDKSRLRKYLSLIARTGGHTIKDHEIIKEETPRRSFKKVAEKIVEEVENLE